MSQITPTQPIQLEVTVDYVCPWCYLAWGTVEKLKDKYPELAVSYSPFPLSPQTPAEGLLLSELLPGADLDTMHKRLYALMDELGLEHTDRDRTYNTQLAQELGLWADTLKDGDKLHAELFKAYFTRNANLADTTVLLEAVAAAGLNQAEAQQVLSSRSYKDIVEQAWQLAQIKQISGVPAFIAGGFQFSGYQPLSEMERFIEYVQSKQADSEAT